MGHDWNVEDSDLFHKSSGCTWSADVKVEKSGIFWALSDFRSLGSPLIKKWICGLYSYTHIQYFGKDLVPQTKN